MQKAVDSEDDRGRGIKSEQMTPRYTVDKSKWPQHYYGGTIATVNLKGGNRARQILSKNYKGSDNLDWY